MSANIRKIVTVVDETLTEMGRPVSPPVRRAAAVAVIENPFAGRYVEDLAPLIAVGRGARQASVRARGRRARNRRARGSGLRQGGARRRERRDGACGGAPASQDGSAGAQDARQGRGAIPSSKKRGGLGAELDIPLGHKDAAYVRSHFDAMQVSINDAPRAGEIVVAVAVTTGGRPLPRVGGLEVGDIKGEDGLR